VAGNTPNLKKSLAVIAVPEVDIAIAASRGKRSKSAGHGLPGGDCRKRQTRVRAVPGFIHGVESNGVDRVDDFFGVCLLPVAFEGISGSNLFGIDKLIGSASINAGHHKPCASYHTLVQGRWEGGKGDGIGQGGKCLP
jgi:hypothetical protein